MNEPGADAPDLIGTHGSADTAPADCDAAKYFTGSYGRASGMIIVGYRRTGSVHEHQNRLRHDRRSKLATSSSFRMNPP